MNTIVWIHGFPLSPAIFDAQRAIRADHIMPALPGFGGTVALEGDATIDRYARFILDELDRRGVSKATFAGVSMGGYICFAIARIAPERIERLILIDTKEQADSDEARAGRFTSIQKVQQQGTSPVVEAMLPKMLTSAAPTALQTKVREVMESASPEGVIFALQAMAARPDSSPLLPELKMPVLIAVGEDDAITPPADAERMAGKIPDARLLRIANAAHLSNLEQPARFNEAVEEFLGG